MQAFLDAAEQDAQHALTGLRLGEALGLFWGDIDWKHHSLAVQRTLSPLGMLRPPKAHSQQRVSFPATVIPVLEEHRTAQRALRARSPEWLSDPDYVFTTGTGHPLSAANVRRSLHRLGKMAHIPAPFIPHDLSYPNLNKIPTFFHKTLESPPLHHEKVGVFSSLFH